jgi:type IV secretory pathway VirB10-like protein
MNNEGAPKQDTDMTSTYPESVDKGALNTTVEQEPDSAHGGWRETFRVALDRARKQPKPRESRQELGRDRTKALVVLVAVAVILLLLFFGLFSSPNKPAHLPGENPHGQPSLGQKATPGQEANDPTKAVAPMLSADVRANDPTLQGQVTPEDIDRTSRTGNLAKPSPASRIGSEPQDYALSRVDFSDPLAGKSTTPPVVPAPAQLPVRSATENELKKPSLVFVRSAQVNATLKPLVPETEEETLALPAGTRLLARLQAPVSSAVAAPVVAVVEYNYEHDGQIVMPAGAKVLGRLAQANPSGDVAIQFSRVEMPDGTAEKLDASAMDLNFKPLKGYVSGKKTGTKFLVRSLTGLGTVASYLVGPQASSSAGLISTNVLMRERLADNIATAGQEELNGLAFNQNLVVTVPGNTRFYIVLQKPTSDHAGGGSVAGNATVNKASVNGSVPTLEELRQLMQLRREINDLYTQNNGQPAAQPQEQP